MPSYAILGATGQTGRALLKNLSLSPDNTLNLYARSESKLISQNSSFSPTPPPTTHFFIGPLTNTGLLASCIKNVDTVFCVVASNTNQPCCRIAQDTAHAVLAAMESLRGEGGEAKLPRLIFLSAGPVSVKFRTKLPGFVNWLLWSAYGHVYKDLEAAEKTVGKEKGWVKAVFVYPAGLTDVDERALGHRVTTEAPGGLFMSYGDLAAGMIEIAKEKNGKYDWVDVTVLPTGKGVKISYLGLWKRMLGGILHGLMP
jgi:hypothetical protein